MEDNTFVEFCRLLIENVMIDFGLLEGEDSEEEVL